MQLVPRLRAPSGGKPKKRDSKQEEGVALWPCIGSA